MDFRRPLVIRWRSPGVDGCLAGFERQGDVRRIIEKVRRIGAVVAAILVKRPSVHAGTFCSNELGNRPTGTTRRRPPGDRGPSLVPAVYRVLGFVAGTVPGVVVGFCTLAGISLAHGIRPGLPAELVGIALSAGSATALVLLVFLPYYGIDLPWLHIALTAVVPAVLCRYAAR